MVERVANALKGKRVVVTRAAEQSESLVTELERRGATAVVLPMVAFGPPDNPERFDQAIRELRNYDWVFLTSQNALRAMRERSEFLRVELREALGGVKIAAVGPATAEAAENAGLRVAHVASRHQGVTLANELAEQVHGKRVLLPRSDRANPALVQNLKTLGAKVTEVCAYKTIRAVLGDSGAAEMMLEEHTDAVLFFSPSAVHHLQELLGGQKFVELSRRSIFAAIGPVTEKALKESGVERTLLAGDTSASAVIETLTDHFTKEGAHASAEVKPR